MADFENAPKVAAAGARAVKISTIIICFAMISFGVVGLFSPIGAPEKIFSAFSLVGGVLSIPLLSRFMAGRFAFYARPWAPLAVAALFMVVGTAVFLMLEWIEHM